MSLFKLESFESHSGLPFDWRIECDDLSPESLEWFAWMIAKEHTFGAVHGIPRGGNKLAQALEKYATSPCDIILIVDDVCTTGGSFEKCKRELFPDERVEGACLFNRGVCPVWVVPIWKRPQKPRSRLAWHNKQDLMGD